MFIIDVHRESSFEPERGVPFYLTKVQGNSNRKERPHCHPSPLPPPNDCRTYEGNGGHSAEFPGKREGAMKPVRFEYLEAFTIVGCPQYSNPRKICPGLAWERLKKLKEKNLIEGAYDFEVGLEVYPPDFPDNEGEFYYMAGIPLRDHPAVIPFGMFAYSVPASEYAVFDVVGIDSLPRAFREIYHDWLPQSGYQNCYSFDFERYRFVPDLKVDIFIPVERK
jgi:predicted transcriptional regulator YdeE